MSPEMMPLEIPKKKTLHIPNIHIEQSEYAHRTELDREAFDAFGKQADTIYSIYGLISDWLKIPYINDDIDSHDERRDWYEHLPPEEKIQMENNKLRTNVLLPLFNIYPMLQRLLQQSNIAEIPENLFPAYEEDIMKLRSNTLSKIDRKKIVIKWEQQFTEIISYIEACTGEQTMAA